ncbi:MAG TPA: hypothetical protein VGA04_07725 [Streptosporangiaceae bacterium]
MDVRFLVRADHQSRAHAEPHSGPDTISETGVAPAEGKPAKIADLFAGVRAYGLLGLVWFNADRRGDWRLNSPAAVAAFAEGAKTFRKPAS